MRTRRIRRVAVWTLLHAAHGVVLTVPTIVMRGPAGVEWTLAVFAMLMIAAAVLESRCVQRYEGERDLPVRDPVAIRVAQFVGPCLLALFWMAQCERLFWPGRSMFPLIGAVILPAGIWLRVEAIRTLGARFVSDVQAGNITHDGIYGWLRHPSELGLLLIAAGGPLLIGSPHTAVAAIVVLAPVSLWRTRREDRALAL